MSEHIPFIFTVVTSAIATTWALRSKLSDIESVLKVHVESDEKKHKEMEGKIIRLESRRGRR